VLPLRIPEMARRDFRQVDATHRARRHDPPIPSVPESAGRRRYRMVPLLLWILGVPGLIILLLLLLGIVHL
jgi:hypothetical protein